MALLSEKESSHTVPQLPLYNTSTRPSPLCFPPVSLMSVMVRFINMSTLIHLEVSFFETLETLELVPINL